MFLTEFLCSLVRKSGLQCHQQCTCSCRSHGSTSAYVELLHLIVWWKSEAALLCWAKMDPSCCVKCVFELFELLHAVGTSIQSFNPSRRLTLISARRRKRELQGVRVRTIAQRLCAINTSLKSTSCNSACMTKISVHALNGIDSSLNYCLLVVHLLWGEFSINIVFNFEHICLRMVQNLVMSILSEDEYQKNWSEEWWIGHLQCGESWQLCIGGLEIDFQGSILIKWMSWNILFRLEGSIEQTKKWASKHQLSRENLLNPAFWEWNMEILSLEKSMLSPQLEWPWQHRESRNSFLFPLQIH